MTSRSRLVSRSLVHLAPAALLLAGACGDTDTVDHSPVDGGAADAPPQVPDATADAPPPRANAGSLLFDGTDDFVRVTNDAALSGLGAITVEAWVRPRGADANAGIVTKARSGVSNGVEYGLDRSMFGDGQGEVAGESYSCTTGRVADLAVDQWTHVALVWGPNQRAPRLYQNGALAGTSACSLDDANLVASARDLFIGSFHSNGAPANFWSGNIDEVRIWSVARSEAQLQADRRRMLDGTEPGLVAYWDFEDGSGDVAADRAGGDQPGQLGAVGADTADPGWSTETPF